MGRKNSSKKRNLDQMLNIDSDSEETQQVTTTQTSISSLTTKNLNANRNNDASVSTGNQWNSSHNDANTTEQRLSISKSSVGVKKGSEVWHYARKSQDGKQASCLLCDFVCSCHSHSTSTIRQHLISKHDKKDLILPPSTSGKSSFPEAYKKELHQLCYYAIIKDGRSFNDLNKTGIKALINKLYPGIPFSALRENFLLFFDEQTEFRLHSSASKQRLSTNRIVV